MTDSYLHGCSQSMQHGVAKTLMESLMLGSGSAIPFLDIHPREMKTYVHKKSCTQMFIAVLVIIVRNWKQPKCESKGEKLCYFHTVEYYLATKELLIPKKKTLKTLFRDNRQTHLFEYICIKSKNSNIYNERKQG